MNDHIAILENRYTLESPLPGSDNRHEIWMGSDEYSAPVLIKRWPFSGPNPDEGERALWDFELRNLFRLTNLPASEHSLITIKDTGIDRNSRHFVMVFNVTSAVAPLETLLMERGQHRWLYGLSERTIRAEAWRGLRRIASGLVQLHEQHILHRTISASTVYVESTGGPNTLRLGGFEWSIRVGAASTPAMGFPRTLTPPEYIIGAIPFSFHTDWYLMGALFARVVAAADPDLSQDFSEQHVSVISKVNSATALNAIERELILVLLAADPDARLSNGELVLAEIDQIIETLDRPLRRTERSHLGLVALLAPGRPLTIAIQEEDDSIRAIQTDEQRRFLEEDLAAAELVRFGSASNSRYMLLGKKLCYEIEEFTTNSERRSGSWQMAFIKGITELRYSGTSEDQRNLEDIRITVFELRQVRRDRWVPSADMIAWERYLPKQTSQTIDQSVRRLHDFFRVTSQIELLMRDSEIFSYTILKRSLIDTVKEEIIIREIPRERTPSTHARLHGDLYDYARSQMHEKRTGKLFFLGDDDSLNLGRIPRQWFWSAQLLNDRKIKLTRPFLQDASRVPSKGYIRSFDQFGQVALISRRNQAIRRLQNHGYLLLALRAPEHVYIDTEIHELPARIDPSLDESKVHAMKSIWRTRPIFVLQGPPGTGKTTLVSHLLKQIFKDDPVAQILISAQAHAAVDVLREKVSREIFPESMGRDKPIQIRLSTTFGEVDEELDQDHVEKVTERILQQSEQELQDRDNLDQRQTHWLQLVRQMRTALKIRAKEHGAPDMCELVKRSANILFCTTTARDLAQLATSSQQFDWSIIEEAGRAHGFDLVLPLQTGHRWLMIGDHEQLPPYRYADFRRALSNLDDVMEDIRILPRRGGLVDVELINAWQSLEEQERSERRGYFQQWLSTFERLYEVCSAVVPYGDEENAGRGTKRLTAMLSRQHRMHPTIAGLISRAYYRDNIVSETVDENGLPIQRVVHPFKRPGGIEGAQIVWVDIPWRRNVEPHGTLEGYEVASDEVEAAYCLLRSLSRDHSDSSAPLGVALLSPYRRQTQLLAERMKRWTECRPSWMKMHPVPHPVVHTVDSFQGNQADVVIVSLVRNNGRSRGRGLGFLDESQRMNVLFSRAERLLVLVGSWDFFRYQLAETPADRRHYLGHWRIALEYVEECSASGNAIRIPIGCLQELLA